MHNTTRRQWLTAIAAASACAALPAWATSNANAVEVWKDPSCGCCQDWIDHMQANGFKVTVHETGNAAVRAKLGLPQRLGSCHTALVGGYLLEGHVPAAGGPQAVPPQQAPATSEAILRAIGAVQAG